ncbi:hypothetical protein [Candidatus Nitrospira salsa]
MSRQQRTLLSSSSNTLWLTFPGEATSMILRSQLLGLGMDHSLLCALPQDTQLADLAVGAAVKGRSLLDGDTYQFETTVQEISIHSQSLRLKPPKDIIHQAARVYPRLAVDLSGTVRPMTDQSKILAVLPVTISDLCPSGCQLTAAANAWPSVSSMQVILTCQLPGSSHTSKLFAKIEWIDPTSELHIGLQFRFQSDSDVARLDLLQWYTSQQAKLINTVV